MANLKYIKTSKHQQFNCKHVSILYSWLTAHSLTALYVNYMNHKPGATVQHPHLIQTICLVAVYAVLESSAK